MKKILSTVLTSSVLLLPAVAFAQIADSSDAGPFQDLLINLIKFINGVLIPFIIGIGFLVFCWGMFFYFIMGGADEEKKVKGRSLMVYATLGFVIIIVFFGIINMLTTSTGLEGETVRDIPTVPVPRG